jgi:hypothetical protein
MRRISNKESSKSYSMSNIIRRQLVFITLLLIPLILQISLIPQITNRSDISIHLPKKSWSVFYSYAYEWDHTWMNPDVEFCWDMVIDNSDNIYLVGSTGGTGDPWDQCIAKFDKFGNEIWNYTGDSGIIDEIDLDSHGDIFIISETHLNKITSDGVLIWTKNYPTELKSIFIDTNDDVYLSGESGGYFAMKCNSTGDLIWNCSWNGMETSQIKKDDLGNVYFAGTTTLYGAGDNDACLVKLNNTGSFQWYRTFGGPDRDNGNALAINYDGSIFLAGSTEIKSGDLDMFVAKFDENGSKEYHKVLGFYNKYDSCRDILLKAEYDEEYDNIYLCGEYYNSGDDRNMAIYSLRASKSFTQSSWDFWDANGDYNPYASAFDSFNNIIIAGWVRSTITGNYDMCFARFGKDSDGEGLSDDQEINLYGTNPNSYDTDHDGLNDYEEVKIYNTNPNNPDTDGDGTSDKDEIFLGLDPNNPFIAGYTVVLLIFIAIAGMILGIPIILSRSRKFINKRKSSSKTNLIP